MGSDSTAAGIKVQFTRSYKVLAARQNALCAIGKDPKDASLDHLGAHKQPGNISTHRRVLSGVSKILSQFHVASEIFLNISSQFDELPEVAKYTESDITALAVKMQ